MKKATNIVGVFVITMLVFAAPVLATLSIVLSWDWMISFLLVLWVVVEMIFFGSWMYVEVNE